jgi:DNA polymerase-4
VVEALSIDEAFLDVRGLDHFLGTPAEIAVRLRREVRERVGLPITVGVARTKFLAKVASGVAKPDGLLVVPPDRELEFLHPLGVERLWGVGRVTGAKLHELGIDTVAEVARLTEEALISMLGPATGRQLHALSHNRDPRRVRRAPRRRSMGAQRALGWRSAKSWETLDATLVALSDRLGRRLRAAHRVCRTVILRLRFNDSSRATRSHSFSEATAQTHTILAEARGLLAASMPLILDRGVTLLGITLTNLTDDCPLQLALPFERGPASPLDAVIDDIRERFGTGAITRAVLVGRDRDLEVPLLPD